MKENLQSKQSGMRLVSNSAREADSFPRDFSFLVFAGTYTESTSPEGERSEGIYVYRMSPEDGALTLIHVMRKIINPSFLALHPGGQFLYAVNEVEQFNGQPGGGVSAFSIDPQTGKLSSTGEVTKVPMPVCIKIFYGRL